VVEAVDHLLKTTTEEIRGYASLVGAGSLSIADFVDSCEIAPNIDSAYLFARSQSDRNDVCRGLAAQGRRANNQQSWERSAKSSMSSLQRNAQTMPDMTAKGRVKRKVL
jgi:hypothetical protein